uniref:tRNA-binding domain-containing protein n=1 Tax=Davidia involucrata TaxID=16924 RepID=A0A5B7B9B9_DAVIN
MASANEGIGLSSKQFIVSSLCKHLKLEPKNFLDDITQHDITTLCTNVLKGSQNEVMKWIAFVENFPVDSEACLKALNKLNDELTEKSVLLGNGMKPSAADIVVFSAIHSSVIGLSDPARHKLPHLTRWMDYIQNVEDFGESFERILLEKAKFEPPGSSSVAKVEVDSKEKKIMQGTKDSNSSEAGFNSKKSADVVKKVTGDNVATVEKKKVPEKEVGEKDKEISVSLLKIQVGLICKAWKHPSADSLLVEEIDVGEKKLRQVVSGLAKYCSPDELKNRRVALITNVKPGKLRDVMSEGLVLCASNEDHTIVEPLFPPEGAKVGECVSFSGHEGKPEDVLNPKKKQLEKITPHLFTDDKGVATFKGVPFMTSAGACTSSIPNASIK